MGITTICSCVPCTTPAYGVPGLDHCAACCYGTLIAEYDHDCPIADHRDWAERQSPRQPVVESSDVVWRCGEWGPRDHPNLPADWPMPPACNLEHGHDGPHAGSFGIAWTDDRP